jgi:hypothetical protein
MSARKPISTVIEVDGAGQVEEPGRRCGGPRVADADSLIGFTVRSRFTGNVFVVTEADEKGGYPTVGGGGCWAMLDAVVVIGPPEGGRAR